MMVLCSLQGGGLMRQAQHGLTVLKDHPDRVRLIRSSARSSAQGMVSSATCTCLDPCMLHRVFCQPLECWSLQTMCSWLLCLHGSAYNRLSIISTCTISDPAFYDLCLPGSAPLTRRSGVGCPDVLEARSVSEAAVCCALQHFRVR